MNPVSNNLSFGEISRAINLSVVPFLSQLKNMQKISEIFRNQIFVENSNGENVLTSGELKNFNIDPKSPQGENILYLHNLWQNKMNRDVVEVYFANLEPSFRKLEGIYSSIPVAVAPEAKNLNISTFKIRSKTREMLQNKLNEMYPTTNKPLFKEIAEKFSKKLQEKGTQTNLARLNNIQGVINELANCGYTQIDLMDDFKALGQEEFAKELMLTYQGIVDECLAQAKNRSLLNYSDQLIELLRKGVIQEDKLPKKTEIVESIKVGSRLKNIPVWAMVVVSAFKKANIPCSLTDFYQEEYRGVTFKYIDFKNQFSYHNLNYTLDDFFKDLVNHGLENEAISELLRLF